MSYDYMKGSTRRVKPLGQPVPMDERQYNIHLTPQGHANQVGQETLKEEYERGWAAGFSTASDEAKGELSREDVLDLLESDDYNTKHGKTIAKMLREEWGIE